MADRGQQACGICRHFDGERAATDAGVRYCHRLLIWNGPLGGVDCQDFTAGETDEPTT